VQNLQKSKEYIFDFISKVQSYITVVEGPNVSEIHLFVHFIGLLHDILHNMVVVRSQAGNKTNRKNS
jgi:hypothetical protein